MVIAELCHNRNTAPQKKTLKHSAEKGAVSPVTNKATCPKIAQTKLPQYKIKARLRHALPKPKQMPMTKPVLSLRTMTNGSSQP